MKPDAPRLPCRGAVLFAVVVLLFSGCRSSTLPPASPLPPPLPEAERIVAEGLAAFRAGAWREAQARFQNAILLDDAMVRAHIHYQDTWVRRARRGTALAEYKARYDSQPTGFNLYLYGRLFEDPAARLEAFNRALEQDPNLAWGFLERALVLEARGETQAAFADLERAAQLAPRDPTVHLNRGYFFLRRNQPHQALNSFSKTTRLDPENDKAYFGLYRTHARYNASRNAMRSLKECLFLQPTHPRYLEELRGYADREANFADLKTLETLLEKTRAQFPDNPDVIHTLGWLRDRLGRPFSAAGCLTRAAREDGLDPESGRELIRLHVRLGQYDRALQRFLDYAPRTILENPANRLRGRWQEVFEATDVAMKAPGAASLHRLARAYVRVGWVEEALQVFDRYRLISASAPGVDPAVAREVEACETFLKFMEVLQTYFENRYRTFQRTGSAGSLREALMDLARLARQHAGIQDRGLLPLETFTFIGSVLDRKESRNHPLVRYFERFNHYLLVGQREGGPPEAVVCSRLHANDSSDRPRLGKRVAHRYVLGYDLKVRSFRESLDQNLGGVTIGQEFFLNMDFIHRWRHNVLSTFREFSRPGMEEDLFFDEAAPAATREEALDLSSPLAARERIYFLYSRAAGEAAGDIRTFLDMVRTHEEGHVLDADRYLPVMAHLWGIFTLALSQNLSPMLVEAYLEGNAESTALAEGPAPRLSLAQLIGFLPSRSSAPPHSVGYYDVVKRIVTEVYDHPERYPGIDRGRNILQQLWRLSPGELRDLGRMVTRERNLGN